LLAEVPEAEPRGQVVLDELSGRVREQDLAAVAGGRDPRRAMECQPAVALGVDRRLARVDPHPDPDLGARGPRMSGERPLRGGGGCDDVARRPEGDEERVPLGAHLPPSGLLERRAEETVMIREDVAVAPAQLLEQAGGALDVGEEKADGAARQPGRSGISSACADHRAYCDSRAAPRRGASVGYRVGRRTTPFQRCWSQRRRAIRPESAAWSCS
jgi:hypothetical protein